MRPTPTGVERTFRPDEIIVSKTDLKGKITYANRLFVSLAGFTEAELIGAPHSIIRHPDMPRSVFKLLWDTLLAGEEIFAYVVNLSANGDHYWVFAHVTPTFGDDGEITGFHSNRRFADLEAVKAVKALYARMCRAEATGSGRGNMARGEAVLREAMGEMSYGEFVFSLGPSTRLPPLDMAA